MPSAPDVLKALRRELVAAGVVREPDNAGLVATPELPPLILEPRGGPPAPGEREAPEDDLNLIVTARHSGDFAEGNVDARFRRRVVVDLVYRSVGNAGLQRAPQVHALVEAAIVRRIDLGLGFVMGSGSPNALYVISAGILAGLGRVAQSVDGTTDVAKLVFEVYA